MCHDGMCNLGPCCWCLRFCWFAYCSRWGILEYCSCGLQRAFVLVPCLFKLRSVSWQMNTVPHWHTFWKWRRQIKWKITNVKACNLCLFRWQVWPAVLLHNTQLLERLREMSSSLTWTGSSNLAWCTGFIYTTLLWITLCKYLMPQSFGLTPH